MPDIDTGQIADIRNDLLTWYEKYHRRLPWRKTRDPYRIWVSEIMLQQTRVDTVVPYYERFISQFPDVRRLAAADLQEVLKCWEGLGYYARARNLHRAVRHVAQDYNGIVPSDPRTFLSLPGVGPYIAAAVLSIAFGLPHAVVDGNVKRVLARMFAIDLVINRPASGKYFQDLADRLLDPGEPGKFNQAVMELGALVCRPKNPACDACPVRRCCRAAADNTVAVYPMREKARRIPCHHLAAGVVRKNGRVLIVQRPASGLLGGLWEFPNGPVKDGEIAEAACIRNIAESVHLDVAAVSFLTQIRHAYTHFKIIMDVFICDYRSGRVRLEDAEAHRWALTDDLVRYPMPKASLKFIEALKEKMKATQ